MTKNLRIVTTVILVLAMTFICCACGGKQNLVDTNVDETTTQVSLRATVLEATDSSILVQSDQEQYRVSNIKQMELQVGDLVEITYDGNIMETDPLQLEGVSKIALITSEDTYMNVDESKESAEVDTMYDRIPMVMVKGKLYYDTGKVHDGGKCGIMDGEITSSVDGSEIPTEDDQSNFGSGFGYQYGEDDTIVVYMSKKWAIFEYRGKSMEK